MMDLRFPLLSKGRLDWRDNEQGRRSGLRIHVLSSRLLAHIGCAIAGINDNLNPTILWLCTDVKEEAVGQTCTHQNRCDRLLTRYLTRRHWRFLICIITDESRASQLDTEGSGCRSSNLDTKHLAPGRIDWETTS